MIQTIASPKAAYWFAETIESTSQNAPSLPVARNAYSQCGLYFIDAQVKNGKVIRAISQYAMSDPFLKIFRTMNIVPLLNLKREHEKRWYSVKNPWGLEIPTILEFTLTNASPQLPEYHVPVALTALHMPTVTPAFPVDSPTTWPASITVKYGFAKLTLDYTVAWDNEIPEAPTATMTFTEQSKTASQDNLTLAFKPIGSWTTTFDPITLQPISSIGKIQYIGTGTIAGKTPTEVLNLKLGFSWKQILVTKTDERVVTQPWASTPL